MIRFLQISDIHFLCCNETEDEYAQMREMLKEDLLGLKNKMGAIPFLLICGDIANKGQVTEFEAAKVYINQLCNVLEVNGQKPDVFVVPGNHDIDRTPYKATRAHLRSKLLCFENKENDIFMQECRKSEPESMKILYSPLKAYTKFADDYSSNDKLNESLNLKNEYLALQDKDLFWKRPIGKLDNYTVNIIGMNSTLACDGNERESPVLDKGEHTLFLPFMGYNVVTHSNEVNISMIHHPLNWLGNEKEVQKVFDDRFKIQFYGHMHKQSSCSNSAIKIYSGALQPPFGEEEYPPIYNYIEIDIKDSKLLVSINCRKWDGAKFCKYKQESKSYSLTLASENSWSEEDKENAKQELPIEVTPIPKHEIIQQFRTLSQVIKKRIIAELLPEIIKENISSYELELDFIRVMRDTYRLNELYDKLNDI